MFRITHIPFLFFVAFMVMAHISFGQRPAERTVPEGEFPTPRGEMDTVGQRALDTLPEITRTMAEVTWFNLREPWIFHPIDTSITGLFIFDDTDRQPLPFRNLGNIGQPHFPLVFDWDHDPGFSLGFRNQRFYFRELDDLQINNPPFPFTHLRYVQGLENEQMLHASHSQNIYGRYMLGADYRITGSEGIYRNQSTRINNLHIYNRYNSPDGRWNIMGGYLWNRVRAGQHGGVPAVDFRTGIKQTIPVNLDNAESEIAEKTFYLQNIMNLGSTFRVDDEDTAAPDIFYSRFHLIHRLNYSNERYRFTDIQPDPDFYPAILLSADTTLDRTHYRSLNNRIGIKYSGIQSVSGDTTTWFPVIFEGFLNHTAGRVDQQGRWYPVQNLAIEGAASINPMARLPYHAGISAIVIPLGTNYGDYKLEVKGGIFPAKNHRLTFSLLQQSQSPDFIYQHYLSNHFYWENDFESLQISRVNVSYEMAQWNLRLFGTHHLIGNYILPWHEDGPVQLKDPVQISHAGIEHQLKFGKFHLNNQVIYQTTPSVVLNFPSWTGRSILYYESELFNGAALAQIGIQGSYNSNYYADAFNPVISQFHPQHGELMTYYPVLNAFANMQVKTARIFFLISHVNQGLPGFEGYMTAPDYPAGDRNFRFGINWMLFN